MVKEFDFTIVGIGADEQEAMENAETKLPFPLNEPQNYKSLFQGAPELFDDSYKRQRVKVEINYNLVDSGEGPVKKDKPTSAGQRNLYELLNK